MYYVPGGNASSTKGEGGEAGKAAKAAKGATTGFQSDAAKKAADKKAKKTKADEASAKKEAKKKAKGGKTDADAKDDKSRGGLDGPTDPFRGGGAGEDEDAAPPKVKKPKTAWAEFIAKDGDGNPLAGLDFELTDIEGDKHKGKTAPNGSGRVEKIPEGLVKVKFPALLTQVPGFTMELKEVPKKKASEAKAPAPAPKKEAPPEEPPKKAEPKKQLPWKNAKPPRDGHTIKNDDANETKWFDKLPPTKWDDLQAGDILIRKTFDTHVMRSLQGGFFLLYGPKGGSPMTIECGILLDDGTVARMSAGAGKAISDKPAFGNWLAFRPMDNAVAKKAVEVATWLKGQKVGYALEHLMDSPELGGLKDAKKNDVVAMKSRKLPRTVMHEGEWLTLILQAAVEKGLDVPGSVYTPGRLEQRLNDDNYKLFTFVGTMALGADDADHESKWSAAVKAAGRKSKRVSSQYASPNTIYMGMGDFVAPYLKLWPPEKKK